MPVKTPTTYKGHSVGKLHEIGAIKFRLEWLLANNAAVEAASILGLDLTSPFGKLLLPAVCYNILLHLDNEKRKEIQNAQTSRN